MPAGPPDLWSADGVEGAAGGRDGDGRRRGGCRRGPALRVAEHGAADAGVRGGVRCLPRGGPRRRGRERHRGAAPHVRGGRARPGRRGRGAVADLRRHGRRARYTRRHAGLRRHRRAAIEPGSTAQAVERAHRAAHEGDRPHALRRPSGRACRARARSPPAVACCCSRTPRTRSARVWAGATSARSAPRRRSASSRTRTWRSARAAWSSRTTASSPARAAAALARDDGAELGPPAAAMRPATTSSRSASTTASTSRARRSAATGSRACAADERAPRRARRGATASGSTGRARGARPARRRDAPPTTSSRRRADGEPTAPTCAAALADEGVQTSVHYPPIHSFSAYAELGPPAAADRRLGPRLLTLPLFPHMTEAQATRRRGAGRRARRAPPGGHAVVISVAAPRIRASSDPVRRARARAGHDTPVSATSRSSACRASASSARRWRSPSATRATPDGGRCFDVVGVGSPDARRAARRSRRSTRAACPMAVARRRAAPRRSPRRTPRGNLTATTDPSALRARRGDASSTCPLDVARRRRRARRSTSTACGRPIRTLGRHMPPGSLVIVETTVPPGTTEKVVAPELARALARARPARRTRCCSPTPTSASCRATSYLDSIVQLLAQLRRARRRPPPTPASASCRR